MILAVCMQKGGSGKTTTTAILAQAAARKSLQVLVIDMDPQKNVTAALGLAADDTKTGDAYGLLTGDTPVNQIHESKQAYIDIVPGTDALSTITTGPGSARRLQDALKPVRALYDLILIDTPPTVGELQYNAILAADKIIIPLSADTYSEQGLFTMADIVRQFQQHKPDLVVGGILFTRFSQNSDYDRQLFREIINKGVKDLQLPFLGTVRPTDKVKEAARDQVSIYHRAPRCAAAVDYINIFNEVTNYKYT